VRLIAEGRGDRASIAEITEEADIGFGSFSLEAAEAKKIADALNPSTPSSKGEE
jgi:hypothetical protein